MPPETTWAHHARLPDTPFFSLWGLGASTLLTVRLCGISFGATYRPYSMGQLIADTQVYLPCASVTTKKGEKMARRIFKRIVGDNKEVHTIDVHTQLTVLSACWHPGSVIYLLTNENDSSPMTTVDVVVLEIGDLIPAEADRHAHTFIVGEDDIRMLFISKNTDN